MMTSVRRAIKAFATVEKCQWHKNLCQKSCFLHSSKRSLRFLRIDEFLSVVSTRTKTILIEIEYGKLGHLFTQPLNRKAFDKETKKYSSISWLNGSLSHLCNLEIAKNRFLIEIIQDFSHRRININCSCCMALLCHCRSGNWLCHWIWRSLLLHWISWLRRHWWSRSWIPLLRIRWPIRGPGKSLRWELRRGPVLITRLKSGSLSKGWWSDRWSTNAWNDRRSGWTRTHCSGNGS